MPITLVPQHVAEVIGDRLLQLFVGAAARVPVVTPSLELRGVPEPVPLHVVVAALEPPLGPQRREGQVLAGAPSTAGPRRPLAAGGDLLPLSPRMVGGVGDQRLELLEQL